MGCKDLDKLKGLVAQGEELIVKADKVREAIESCPTAAAVLKALFGDQLGSDPEKDMNDRYEQIVSSFINSPLDYLTFEDNQVRVDGAVVEAVDSLGGDCPYLCPMPDLDELCAFFNDLSAEMPDV